MDLTMREKIVLVTGATSGIGEVAAMQLGLKGARMLVVGRNSSKVDAVVSRLKADGGQADGFTADLSSKAEICRLSDEIHRAVDHVDVLLNNAGAYITDRRVSVDGYEMTFALNHLNYFMLTGLLLDLLKTGRPARVVNVSSAAHVGGHVNFDDLQSEKGYSSWKVYSNTKLMNVLFTYELARRLEGTLVTANALHPGFVATNFGRSNGGFFKPFFGLAQLAAIPPEEGAKTSIHLASSPDVEGVSGKYFSECKPVSSSRESYDRQVADRLWRVSEELTQS
jgi:NAD(P)-dependent dehydrogenase (short-subunit alcohol dehydrogenase family)